MREPTEWYEKNTVEMVKPQFSRKGTCIYEMKESRAKIECNYQNTRAKAAGKLAVAYNLVEIDAMVYIN